MIVQRQYSLNSFINIVKGAKAGAIVSVSLGLLVGAVVSLFAKSGNRLRSFLLGLGVTTLGGAIVGALCSVKSKSGLEDKIKDFVRWKNENAKALETLATNSQPPSSDLGKIKRLIIEEKDIRKLCPEIYNNDAGYYDIYLPSSPAEWIDVVAAYEYSIFQSEDYVIPVKGKIPCVSVINEALFENVEFILFYDPILKTYNFYGKPCTLKDFFLRVIDLCKKEGIDVEFSDPESFEKYNQAFKGLINKYLK